MSQDSPLPPEPPAVAGQPCLPNPRFEGTYKDIHSSLLDTEIILDNYYRFIVNLQDEWSAHASILKGRELVNAGKDLRRALSQYQGLCAAFLQKSREQELNNTVKANRDLNVARCKASLLTVAEAQVFLSDHDNGRLDLTGSSALEEVQAPTPRVWQGKSVESLVPDFPLSAELSGADFESWKAAMETWSAASGFDMAPAKVQVAFAGKHVEKSLHEDILEKAAAADGIGDTLTFTTYLEQAAICFKSQCTKLIRRMKFFNLRPDDISPIGFIGYMKQLKLEFTAAQVGELMDPNRFSCYRALCEMPPALRSKVLYAKTGDEITYTEVIAELEKINGLRLLEGQVDSRKRVLRLEGSLPTSTVGVSEPRTTSQTWGAGAQEHKGTAGAQERRSSAGPAQTFSTGWRPKNWPKDLCMRCGCESGHPGLDGCPVTVVYCEACSRDTHNTSVCRSRRRAEDGQQHQPQQQRQQQHQQPQYQPQQHQQQYQRPMEPQQQYQQPRDHQQPQYQPQQHQQYQRPMEPQQPQQQQYQHQQQHPLQGPQQPRVPQPGTRGAGGAGGGYQAAPPTPPAGHIAQQEPRSPAGARRAPGTPHTARRVNMLQVWGDICNVLLEYGTQVRHISDIKEQMPRRGLVVSAPGQTKPWDGFWLNALLDTG